MSAARLDLAWDTQNEFSNLAVTFISAESSRLNRRIGSGRRPARCPECDAIIYSRRHRLCGVCNQPLPEHLMFTGMEAKRVEAMLTVEREKHRKWMEQREAYKFE